MGRKLQYNIGLVGKRLSEAQYKEYVKLKDEGKNVRITATDPKGPFELEVMNGGKRMTRKARMSKKRKTMRRRR